MGFKRQGTFSHGAGEDEDDELPGYRRKRPCFCRLNDTKRTLWDLFVMILATFNVFAIPFNVAFEPEFMEAWYFEIINGVIDFLFLVDILVSFRTTSIDPATGDEITNVKRIAQVYLRGRFWVDFLATVPFDKVGELIVQEGSEGSVLAL